MLKSGAQTDPPKSIKTGSKMGPKLGAILCWFLLKTGPQIGTLFQLKLTKNLNFTGGRNGSKMCLNRVPIFNEKRDPPNHQNIEKTIGFPLKIENHTSRYRPRFCTILDLQNPPILEAKNHQKPLRDPSGRDPKNGPNLKHVLCWF